MRIPGDFDRYKSDGRTIELDLNDPAMAQSDNPGAKPTAQRFADGLPSNGWNVSTQHSGPMRVGGRASEQDKSVASLELLLLDEFSRSGVVY